MRNGEQGLWFSESVRQGRPTSSRPANPYSTRRRDCYRSPKRFQSLPLQDTPEEIQERLNPVFIRSQEQHPTMRPGRIESNVPKALVSRDEEPPFNLNGLPQGGILGTAHPLPHDRLGLMPRAPKYVSHPRREIFVNLDGEPHRSARQGQNDFSMQDLRGIGEGSPDIFDR